MHGYAPVLATAIHIQYTLYFLFFNFFYPLLILFFYLYSVFIFHLGVFFIDVEQ